MILLVVGVVVGLLVAGGLAAGVWYGMTVLSDRPALVARAARAEGQVAALDGALAVSRAQYDAERQLWAAAFDESGRSR